MSKSRLKKKSRKSKLMWIVIALAIFLGGSVYAALQTGTGPLSFLSKPPDVNKIACRDDDDDCIEANFMAKRQGLKGAEADKVVTQITTQLKNDNKFIRNEAGKVIKNPDYDPSQTTSTSNTSSNTSNSTTSTSSSAQESCAGGNGVKLTPGKYAATGYGWKDGKRSTESGTSQRECVLIDDDCGHSTVRACDEVYKAEPAKVILPVSAGTEYYAGKTPAQIKEDEKKNNIPPPTTPKENCYDKSGVIMVTGSQLGSDRCFNGAFISEGEFDTEKAKTCNSSTQKYNPDTNNCDPLPPPPPGGNTPPPPTAPTEQQIQDKKDECRGKSKEYDATNNDCGKALKCGPGYVERAGFCDLAPGSTSEIIRENIITSGDKFCKEQDKKFEQSTGLCISTNQTPSAGRPRECDPKKMYSQGTKEGYRFCEFDSSNKVIGEKYVFCDSSTSTYDSKKGSCVSNKYPNAGNECGSSPAIKDTSGTWIGTPSCGQSCGGLGSYPKDGKLYCNSPSAPTVSVRPDPTKITNQNGIVGAYANDPGECKYGNGAIKETNGKYACPTDTLANPVLDSIPTPITLPENNPTVQARLDKMANDIKASGKCTDSIIDVGIRIVCDPDTKEPTFDFCDGGNGRFDNNGKCIPVLANDDSLNAPITPNTPTKNVAKTTTTGAVAGCAAGATVGAIYGAGLGFGVFSAPLAILGGVIGCGAGAITGGAIGLGISVANTPSTPATQYDKADLQNVVKDAEMNTLNASTLTDDPGKCKNGGGEMSGFYGGSAEIGYRLYKCN